MVITLYTSVPVVFSVVSHLAITTETTEGEDKEAFVAPEIYLHVWKLPTQYTLKKGRTTTRLQIKAIMSSLQRYFCFL